MFKGPQTTTINEMEISNNDVLQFLKSAYREAVLAGVIGLAISTIYLVLAQKQYEANAFIVMAQVANNTSNIYSPQGISVEEPANLIARLKMSKSYPIEVIEACAQKDEVVTPFSYFSIAPIKSTPNIVDLKATASSPKLASSCAQAIFEFIKSSQSQMANQYLGFIKIELLEKEALLRNLRAEISKDSQSNVSSIFSLSLNLEQVRVLTNEIQQLKKILTSYQNKEAYLISPINADNNPVTPKKSLVLLGGLISGLCLGLLLALARQLAAGISGRSTR
ncbi:hypothetical protein [Polynucleobacter sp. KF022]|uniref:hypothetical protein n=1 Tax=Polynucleobacter sp. KF022 TaxID=2982615 RepID=UPI00237786F4|nr:hypothetical protein [Polynucleobacter sp. KF022]BDT74657.1 hypothetical protein PKF022_03220 [Polynucleobacter sp. KF022]